jgi:3-hydroxyisobutyrate dehydrogenase-like beta-hydroxyacid dehydrogenase
MAQEKVGIVGLGLLGGALAVRLLHAGFDVIGYDIDYARVAEFVQCGGTAAAMPEDVMRLCPRVLLSLPTSEIVAQVIERVQAELRPGLILLDTTTGEPGATAALGTRLAGQGVSYLDATVAGSSAEARRGEVLVMVGGPAAIVSRCLDLFGAFAQRTVHVGEVGSGARMKLVFNLVLGLNRAVLAEGLTFAKVCGLELETTLEVLRAGTAYARVMDTKGEKMIRAEFAPQARLTQHLKDVRLILAAASQAHADLPLSSVHCELLEWAEAAGYGTADNAAIIKAFENRTERAEPPG